MHWTVEELDEARAQMTLETVSGFETDFLCLVNINTVLRLPWKEQLDELPFQKVQWPFLFASRWPMTCEIVLRENHTDEHPLNIARGSIEHPDGAITFVALDCPSDPRLSRMATSRRIQESLGLCCRRSLWRLQLPSKCRIDAATAQPHPRSIKPETVR